MDKFYVYRPMLDLLGVSEGTDPPKGRGYNETLAYGAFTGGPVNLVSMTLNQVDALQGKMLAHPKNKMNSSAAGRYQIVRATRRTIQKETDIPGTALFDAGMQDRMGCYLLGLRGIDKWLAGRLKLNTLLTNLAQEWASLPTPEGKSYYGDQRAGVTVAQVKAALNEVRRRHLEGQPETVVVEKPVVPEKVETEAKKNRNWLTGWLFSFFSTSGVGAWLAGMNWQGLALIGGMALIVMLLVLFFGEWGVRRMKKIREVVNE